MERFKNYKISFLPSNLKHSSLFGDSYEVIDSAAFEGNSEISKATNKDFLQLIRVYQTLYDIFKKNGDKESANGCYAKLKQVETHRWKYLYTQNPTFETYFRWKLNQFLNYFTD